MAEQASEAALAALAAVEFTWWLQQDMGWIPDLASAAILVQARSRDDDALALELCRKQLEAHPNVYRVTLIQMGPLKHPALRVWVRGHPGVVPTVVGEALGKPNVLL